MQNRRGKYRHITTGVTRLVSRGVGSATVLGNRPVSKTSKLHNRKRGARVRRYP